MSFFGKSNKPKGTAGPIVSQVQVKKPSVLPASRAPYNAGSKTAGSSNGVARSVSSTAAGSKAKNGHSYASPKAQPAAKSSSSLSKTGTPVRPGLSKNGSAASIKSSPHASSASLSRKRRTPSPIRSESSSSGSDSKSSSIRALTPKHSSRHKRARLVRRGTDTVGATPVPGDEAVGRAVFCLDKVDESGAHGRGWAGFVGSEDVVRGLVPGWGGGDAVDAKAGTSRYHAYFPQPGFENAEPLPSVELLYPGRCKEKFILLNPNTPREYSPLTELRNAMRFILEHYIPPSHAHVFGTLNTSTEFDLDSIPSRLQSPSPAAVATPPPSDGASPAAAGAAAAPTETIGDAVRKALAPNRRDGPALIRAVERFNTAFEEILADGTVLRYLEQKAGGADMSRKDWAAMVDFVHDQAYSRVVGPYSHELEHHPKHPDEVAKAITAKEDAYGELRHSFMSQIIEQTKLGPQHSFGVGNCVVQAALQAGCRSFGIELLPVPAHCARLQRREVLRRWAMWGLNGNTDVEFVEGDFRGNEAVSSRLREADVVLVNNEVFPASLNSDLTDMFLDLKEGATIISLKPFGPESFKINESNCDSFAAILRMSQHTYHRDWVSWKGDSGRYYVQVIDHSMRIKFEESMTSGRRRR